MKTPKNWKEITVNQWREIRSIKTEDFDNLIDYQIERIAVTCGVNPFDEYFDDIGVRDLSALYRQIVWINQEPAKGKISKVKDLHYIGAKGWTLGQFIDLTKWCETDFVENFEKICASVYRKKKIGEWGEEIIEPYYVYDKLKRSQEFSELPITDLYGVIHEVLEYRGKILTQYAPLFSDSEEDEEEEDEKEKIINALERIEKMKRDRQEQVVKKYSWERFVYCLANEDVTKYKEVLRLPLVYVLNTMSMKKEFKI